MESGVGDSGSGAEAGYTDHDDCHGMDNGAGNMGVVTPHPKGDWPM